MNPETLRTRGGDHREEIFGILAYWQESNDLCRCDTPVPIGACLCCDMERLENMISESMFADDSDSIVGSCNCLTKSPDIRYHKRGCKYRLISERDALRATLEEIARQPLAVEMDDHSSETADWEGGYEALVEIARAATRTPVPESPPCPESNPVPDSGIQIPRP